jgi:hypothetical protein
MPDGRIRQRREDGPHPVGRKKQVLLSGASQGTSL